MPFYMKNAYTTYPRLVDVVFSNHIGCILEVYIDDMVAKTPGEGNHYNDLDEILKSGRSYNRHMNPSKCYFGVQADRFLGFMLTRKGIKLNLEKI